MGKKQSGRHEKLELKQTNEASKLRAKANSKFQKKQTDKDGAKAD